MALVKYNNNSISAVTSAASIPSGALTHIKTLTASSSSTLSFVHGSSDVVLDSTYPIYKFEFINCHPANNLVQFQFNMSADSGSNYNVTKTTTIFVALHDSTGSSGLTYRTNQDLAQGTGFQSLSSDVGNLDDDSVSGSLYLFNPSSTTFVKHFIATTNRKAVFAGTIYLETTFIAGYGNTTSAIDGVRFQFNTANIDAGKIKLYGIKDS